MSYPRYGEYKDSGVEWLGEVPVGWEVLSTRRVFSIINGSTPKSDVEQYWGGEIVWVTPEDLSKVESRFISSAKRRITRAGYESCGTTLVPVGSIILTTRAPIGNLGIANLELCTNQGCKSLVALNGDTNSSYFYYLMFSFSNVIQSLGKGTTFLELSNVDLSGFSTVQPTLPEQRAIAAFLDRETARIDALIAKQEQLIALLHEKRKALISHAVTRGLDPDALLKDSGMEWLGMVPEHWNLQRAKHVLRQIIDTEHKTAPFYPDGEFLVARTSNIKDGKLTFDDAKFTDKAGFVEWTLRGKPESGDILFTREAPAGEACIVPSNIDLCVGQRTVLLKLNKALIDNRFLLWSIYGGLANEFIKDLSQGSTVNHLNMADIKNIPLLVPHIDEQRAIADHIDGETAKIDTLIAKAQTAIDLLKEHRSSLISAAVTGKIDVRGLVPPHP